MPGRGDNYVDSSEPPGGTVSQHSPTGSTGRTTSACWRNCDLDLNDACNISGKVVMNSLNNVGSAILKSGNGASITPDHVAVNSNVTMKTSVMDQVLPKLAGYGKSNIRPYPLFCGTCRLRLNAPRQAREHFEGKAHARRLRLTGENASDCDKNLISIPQTGELSSKIQVRIKRNVQCA